ncbi:MAG: chromate transporter [Clostridiales bacterium]|jgi:chromate transporter|nr:chromate transporter [Eubacteriales bacterium]MDH7566435.1 chromate transporter [Clostridiales bacterium]
MTLVQLLVSFLKIGAFSFGGGYAMIPFFEKEIALHGWTAAGDYAKMVAIAQIFPGPFAIDSSAYIGFKVAGLPGAVVASAALSLPSFVALVFITRSYVKFKDNRYIQMLLAGVRPVVIGLLVSAVYIIGLKPVVKTWEAFLSHPLPVLKTVVLILLGFLAMMRIKANPIIFIIAFAVIGMVVF